MRIDDLISKIAQHLAIARNPQTRAILANQLLALQQSVAIRVNTKTGADAMLNVYKQSLAPFPYPFGEHGCWGEISTGSKMPLCYLLMAPDDTWPHWQIYLNWDPPYVGHMFAWSPDGRVGPYLDRPGGFPCGPTLFIAQDSNLCRDCRLLDAEADHKLVCDFVPVDPQTPAWMTAMTRHKVCQFVLSSDTQRCPRSVDAWDAALLPISVILYIALAPVRELDISWQPPRVLGHGKSLRHKVGYYQLTPIKKIYFHRRVTAYVSGERRHLEKRFFVRGHVRRSHFRCCPSGVHTKVKEAWVRLYWKGPEGLAVSPHRYTVDWPTDGRVEAAQRLAAATPFEKVEVTQK